MFSVEIRHNFETAHRLTGDGAPEKCMSIHGHSWWVTATMEGDTLDALGILVEFGAFKRVWRDWLDNNLDHHLVLRNGDPMAAAIVSVYPQSRLLLLPHNPTTEVLAAWIFEQTAEILGRVAPPGVRLRRVHVQETAVNAAAFEP